MSLSSALLKDTFKRSSLDDNLLTLRKSTIGARKASIKAVNVFRKRDNIGTTIYRKERRLNQLFRFRQERRNRESALEASSVPGSGLLSITLNKCKGFLGRIMNALGYLLLGWLTTQLPRILALIETLKVRIGNIVQAAKRMIQDIRNIIGGLKGVVTQAITNIKNFDFTDKEGKLQKEIDDLEAAVESLGTNWDDALFNAKNLTTPPEEKEQKPEKEPEYYGPGGNPDGSGQGQAQQRPEEPTTPSGPSGTNYRGRLKPIHIQALNKISEYESAGSGNYNAMNQGTIPDSGGRKPASGPSSGIIGKNLTDMTIAEILAAQNLSRQNNQGFIYAAGRYQFLSGTLQDTLRYANISRNVKFSPDVQDYLAAVLLTMPGGGLSHWTADKRTGLLKDQAGMDLINEAARTPLGKSETKITSPPTQQIPPPAQPQQPPPQTTSGSLMPLSGTTGRAKAPQGQFASVSVPTSPILKSKSGAYTPKITSGMGMRDLGAGPKKHNGIDVGASRGTPLFSYLPGKVYQTGRLGAANDGSYGNWITWKDDKFNAYHFFGHMNEPSPLRKGQSFGTQTMLGTVGGSGDGDPNKYADHLHWEISNNVPDSMGNFRPPTDPISWMNKNFRGVENQRTISKGRASSGQRVAIIPIEIPVAQPVPVGSSSQTIASSTNSAPDMLNKLGNIQLAYT